LLVISFHLAVLASRAAAEAQRYVLYSSAMKNPDDAQDEMVIAIVWYRPEQWERVRDVAADAEELEMSYVEWLQAAEEKFKELQSSGLRVEKVDVDSEKLILWCNERGLENNGKARSRYAAERLSELDKNRSLIQHDTSLYKK
jgi:hypothetical protein